MKTKILQTFIISVALAVNVSAQEYAGMLHTSIWQSNTISVCWDNPTPEYQAMMDTVRAAIRQTWEKYTLLSFTDWCASSKKDCDIHIFISDEAPHTIALGSDLRNKPHGMVLNFSFNKWALACSEGKIACIKAIAVHEFGHALGLAHEQNRDDCNLPNCLNEDLTLPGNWYVSPCDTNSVMNNCYPKSKNSGQLSQSDIETIQYLYGTSSFAAQASGNNSIGNQDSINSFYLVSCSQSVVKKNPVAYTPWHDYMVYISNSNNSVGTIQKVVYHLGSQFKTPNITITSKEDNFAIKIHSKDQFEISADIYVKGNINKIVIKKYIGYE